MAFALDYCWVKCFIVSINSHGAFINCCGMFGRNNNERMVVLLYNRLRWLNYLYNMIVGGAGSIRMLYSRKRDIYNDWRNMLASHACYSTMTKQND